MPNAKKTHSHPFESSFGHTNPRIAARREAVRMRRITEFDKKLHIALYELANVLLSEELQLCGGASVVVSIAKLSDLLIHSDSHTKNGFYIREKIAEFLIEQQVVLSIISEQLVSRPANDFT